MSGYREYAPAPDLASHVACTWSHTLTHAHAVPIVPDGCVDIVVYDDQAPHVAGPQSRVQLVVPAAAVITGLRLRPGAAQRLLGCPMDRLLNGDARLVDVSGRVALRWSSDVARQRAALEQWVRSRLERTSLPPLALRAAELITRDPGVSLDVVLAALDVQTRRLHRELTAACGYGPKLLQRIMRLQHTLRLAARTQLSLAALARSAGYADQAHMTRDFRALTGETPARYLARQSGEVGQWLDEGAVRFVQSRADGLR